MLIYKKKISFFLKKIYPILFHNFENKLPEVYNYDFNWIMNDIGIYNLKAVKKDFESRLKKAKLYDELINEKVADKTNCFSDENALLEYTIILKNVDNQKAHDILMNEGFDIRHTWYINNIKKVDNLNKEDFENTFFLEKKIFCLPLHKNINENDIRKISKIINKFV